MGASSRSPAPTPTSLTSSGSGSAGSRARFSSSSKSNSGKVIVFSSFIYFDRFAGVFSFLGFAAASSSSGATTSPRL